MSALRTVIVAFCLATASAFVASPRARTSTSLGVKNGWVPDANAFAWGLPGSGAPIPDFDPLGFAQNADLDQMKKYREAETQHGRVAMLAALGILVGENYHPLFGLQGKEILAIDSLTEVRIAFPAFFEILAVAIGALEFNRALVGWADPTKKRTGNTLEEDYYPGDVGFDPLNLKPEDAEDFAVMQKKEINNGRLAMIGVAGMVAQELVDRKPILFNDFGIGTLLDQSNPLY